MDALPKTDDWVDCQFAKKVPCVRMDFSNSECRSPFSPADESLLTRSTLYRELIVEREEIMRHKWFESEKVGRDIGFEQALVNWLVHHRANWRATRTVNSPRCERF